MTPAPCHPDRKHHARGLCSTCYHRARMQEPELRARFNARSLDRYHRNNSPQNMARMRGTANARYRAIPEVRERKVENTRRRRAAQKALLDAKTTAKETT